MRGLPGTQYDARMRHFLLLLPLLAAALGGCTDGNASFDVRPSVAQIYVTHAPPGAALAVYDAAGGVVASGSTDALGSLVFRGVAPGGGYTVRTTAAQPAQVSRHLTVLSAAGSQPGADFYHGQTLKPGFNYITTRDGTTLSAYVTLPGRRQAGPVPHGRRLLRLLAVASPARRVGNFAFLCDSLPVLCDAPNDGSALLAALFGYATVSVNMRGTGCSGGAYDFFEELQLLDGYDVIETVAAQDWVASTRSAWSASRTPASPQLFVAHDAAAAAWRRSRRCRSSATPTRRCCPAASSTTASPLAWITNVLDKAKPYGQGWEQTRVDARRQACAPRTSCCTARTSTTWRRRR